MSSIQLSHPRPELVIPHDDLISTVAYLPDGRRVVTGSNDGTLRVWNLESKEQEGTLMKHDNTVSSLAVTRDGTKIISIDNNGRIKIWDAESHELVKEWTHPGSFPSFAISPDDCFIAVGYETTVFYSMEGTQVNRSIDIGSRVSSICFSPDGGKLSCGTGYDVRVYDVSSCVLLLGPLKGHKDWVRRVLWSCDGSTIFSTSYDKTIRCWNAETGEPVGQPWRGHTDWVYTLSLSPDGSVLASVSNDRTVRLWNTTSGISVGQLQHDTDVAAVCFSPCGELVLSAGEKGMIYMWRVPMSDAIESRVTTSIRCTSVFLLIAFPI